MLSCFKKKLWSSTWALHMKYKSVWTKANSSNNLYCSTPTKYKISSKSIH